MHNASMQLKLVCPFSFGEYMQYFNYDDKYAAIDKYMIEGVQIIDIADWLLESFPKIK